jgi:hypothetical protein
LDLPVCTALRTIPRSLTNPQFSQPKLTFLIGDNATTIGFLSLSATDSDFILNTLTLTLTALAHFLGIRLKTTQATLPNIG